MSKIIFFFQLILRSKLIFKTPKKCDLVIFDEASVRDLNICLSKFNSFVLQTRLENLAYILGSKNASITAKGLERSKYKIYFSYKILRKILKNYYKGNLFTVYLIALIELINPKVVITTIDISFKFSDVAKILGEKINFIAIQNELEHDFLDWSYLYNTKKLKQDLLKKIYIPNLFCMADYEVETWKRFVRVKNFYVVGSLRLANFFHHIKAENNSPGKYNCDICLLAPTYAPAAFYKKNTVYSELYKDENIEKGSVKLVEYTIKFCLKHNMKLIIPLKRDKKYLPGLYKVEMGFFERNFKKEELDYIKKNMLDNELYNFSSYRVMLNSKVAIGRNSTLLRNKLTIGGKILSCNLTKVDRYDFPANGICTLNNCSYVEFEKRLLEIYSTSKDNYFSKIDNKPDYREKFSTNYSTIHLIREKLSQLGINQI